MARRIHPDLEASAYPLLAHIADHPGVRGSELAAHFGVAPTEVLRRLREERAGALESAGKMTRKAVEQHVGPVPKRPGNNGKAA